MSKASQINQALKAAMKQRRAADVAALRLVLAAINNQKIANRGSLTDADTVRVLQQEAKKRRKALEIYERAGRRDLAGREKLDLEIIGKFSADL